MTLVQKEVKAVYKGTVKVRPEPTYTYSYDFRNKTASNLTTDGWSFQQGQSYFSSDGNGCWCGSGGNNTSARISIGNVLTNAQKLKIQCLMYVNKVAGGDSISLYNVNSSNSNGNGFYVGAQSATGSGGISTNFNGSGSYQSKTMVIGDFRCYGELDFVNKTYEFTVPNYSITRSGTMTDAQITTAKANDYLRINMFANANVPVYKLKTAEIIVE